MKLLKFSAEWCAPCKQLKKDLDNYLPNYPEIELIEMPIESNKDSAEYYNIRSVPTLVMLNENNQVLRTITGYNPKTLGQFLAGT